MSATFYELLKYGKTGLASPDMTAFDKLKAMAMAGGGLSPYTIIGQPPISFKSDGTPLTSVTIKGNGSQASTPTPSAPIPFDGTGDRTGNLWTISPNANVGYNLDVGTVVSDSAGPLQVSASDDGMILTSSASWQSTAWKIPVEVGDTYYVSFASASTNLRCTIYTADETNTVTRKIGVYTSNFPQYKDVTIQSDEKYIVISLSINAITTVKVTEPMITTDITDYEPYGYSIPLTCASQTTPLYLGEVSTTRRVRKLVLTGEETRWTTDITYGGRLYRAILTLSESGEKGDVTACYCTHYPYNYGFVDGTLYIGAMSPNKLYINDNAHAIQLETWKQFLRDQYAAGTPVVVWYVLATEQTGIVNEPLMKIGDYCDELTTTTPIPTAKGSNTLTVDTTVQPSEISISGNIKPE